ncbi:MAG: hypothetical protein Q9166_007369 [cf. Caloplaca sp. 2 TL-2023]
MADPHEILSMRAAVFLVGKNEFKSLGQAHSTTSTWSQGLTERISTLIKDHQKDEDDHVYQLLHDIGVAALDAFLQSNVTGPPLGWDSADLLFPPEITKDTQKISEIRQGLIQDLSVDGEAVYQLIPNIELFCLAKCVLNHPASIPPGSVPSYLDVRWARVTVNFWHQKLLGENAASLQEIIYQDLDRLEEDLRSRNLEENPSRLIQRATIHTQHGFDQRAMDDLKRATQKTGLAFELTGRLGKRTKFQENELSQLVVLAKSADSSSTHDKHISGADERSRSVMAEASGPEDLNLNDDTLLESITFSKTESNPSVPKEPNISLTLAALDPSKQPTLKPLDSIILLAYASSITNTSPSDGLTREETLPYATRVLQGKSTNWQIYTQALLARSRIEGYRSRTLERGVLQLQALVDQVIVETTPTSSNITSNAPSIQVQDDSGTSSFLPRPKPSESAPASERLAYIHQLASPSRWELEAELASRWVSLGGLRTALEIYERLQMWAEVALCWAANDREDKAKKIICRQLYTSASSLAQQSQQIKPSIDDEEVDIEALTVERNPLPADAPRLFCILGDLEKSPSAYEKAWEISNHRYARAQRSLGKYYFGQGDLQKADEAYAKSLKVNALNHATWFSLGCVRLQTENWTGAVDAFSRAIQIEEKDAESWSNMAAALIQIPVGAKRNGIKAAPETSIDLPAADDDLSDTPKADPHKNIRSAFIALKRAAALKRESHRIWQNLLTVAVKLSPPPYSDIIIAQTRLIDLRSNIDGEKCIDVEVMEGLLAHLIATSHYPPPSTVPAMGKGEEAKEENGSERGFQRMLISLIHSKIAPLITTSRRLHLLCAKLALHLQRPTAALEAYEKAWRCALNVPGWENGSNDQEAEGKWREVVDATVELLDAYESIGERRMEGEGKGEGEGGEALVCRAWKFKGRSAVRGVLGRGKEIWDGSEGFRILQKRLEELRGRCLSRSTSPRQPCLM